jgi:hypothetical protein
VRASAHCAGNARLLAAQTAISPPDPRQDHACSSVLTTAGTFTQDARATAFTFVLTGRASRADTSRVGFAIRWWLREQPLHVQCVVFGVFALIGSVFLWAGLVIGDWRRIAVGVTLAVAWPLDTLVWPRIKMHIDARLYR